MASAIHAVETETYKGRLMAGHTQRPVAGGLAGVFAENREALLRFIAARCGDPAAAEDLLQDLWIRTETAKTGPIANARAYLFRMANNIVLDSSRARRRAMLRDRAWIDQDGGCNTRFEDRPDPAPSPDHAIGGEQEAELLRNAIDELPAGAARALRLHRLNGLKQAEVAQEMGISVSAVEKHLANAMKHLRNALSDCGWYEAAASRQHGPIGGGEPPREPQR